MTHFELERLTGNIDYFYLGDEPTLCAEVTIPLFGLPGDAWRIRVSVTRRRTTGFKRVNHDGCDVLIGRKWRRLTGPASRLLPVGTSYVRVQCVT